MRIFAVDTAGDPSSIAASLDGDVAFADSLGRAAVPGDAIIRHVRDRFDECGLDASAFELFACAIGPGSFTGLRVGLGLAKTLAWSTGSPVAGIDTVALLAHRALEQHLVDDGERFTAAVVGIRDVVFSRDFVWDGRALTPLGAMAWHENPDAFDRARGARPVIAGGRAAVIAGAQDVDESEPAAVVMARVASDLAPKVGRAAGREVQPLYLKPFGIGKKAPTIEGTP